MKPDEQLDERDWFAAHAPLPVIVEHLFNPEPFGFEHLAAAAYQYADAMMKRRKIK